MYTITKSLPVCLDQILHFDVYKITLDHILSLEPSIAEFFVNESRNQELVEPI